MIEIKHHGAVNGVTGSCHELRVPDFGILVDCGLFQGQEKGRASSAMDLAIDFPIDHIRALVVTHVHIDHVGRIPYLLAAGFDGPIVCSEPSAIMLPEILEDALKIGFTRDRALIIRVLERIRSQLVPLPYGQWHEVVAEGDAALKSGCKGPGIFSVLPMWNARSTMVIAKSVSFSAGILARVTHRSCQSLRHLKRQIGWLSKVPMAIRSMKAGKAAAID